MANKKKHKTEKAFRTGLLDKEENAMRVTSEGSSSDVGTNMKDHQFKVPTEKASHKLSKKRKFIEMEEQEINVGAKASNEKEFQAIRAMYSLSGGDDRSGEPRIKRDVVGFAKRKRKLITYEQMLFELPPGIGTPPEDIEDIPEESLYFPHIIKYLKSNGDFTREEVEKVIEERIAFLLDYFKRFEEGRLTKEERRNGKTPPENFCGPYLPTPKHIRRLKGLDIEINWPLSELHEICLRNKGMAGWALDRLKKFIKNTSPGLQVRLGRVTKNESEVLIKNWIKFQKEYKFYDIRPLLGVKTIRLLETKGKLDCQVYNYVTKDTTNKFLLYLLRGLPDRNTSKIRDYLNDVFVRIRGVEFVEKEWKKYSLFERYGVEYILRKFGACWLVVELLLGDQVASHYQKFFSLYVAPENIPMRIGPWLPAECKRLERGILTVLGVNTLKESVGKKIPWPKLLPFVRTRNINSYYVQYKSLLKQREVTKKNVLPFGVEKQLIESIYESGAESFQEIDWEDIERSMPNQKAGNLKKHVRYLMFKVPVFCRRNFVETLEYLYKFMNDRYKMRNGLTGRTMAADSTTEEEDWPDSSNMSVLSDTTYIDDLESDYSFVNELFDN